MNDIQTSRLCLCAVDAVEGERIFSHNPGPEDHWAFDFPFDGDIRALTGFLSAWVAHGDQRPFGYYRISLRSNGLTIGGVGFKGSPTNGCVEVGYGLVPSARGQGYAAEAVTALLAIAKSHGVTKVVADTSVDNIASQRTLLKAGFHLKDANDDLHLYEISFDS